MSRMTLILILVFMVGCATSRPQISIELKGQVEDKKPEYTVNIRF
jgi:hypothetical protein